MEVDAKVMQELVEYVGTTQPLLQEAAEQETKAAEMRTKVAALAPTIVDVLIKQGFVPPEIRDRAIANIQDPIKALESLQKIASAQTVKQAEVPSMGTGADLAHTGSDTRKMKESDQVFLRKFGFIQ